MILKNILKCLGRSGNAVNDSAVLAQNISQRMNATVRSGVFSASLIDAAVGN